MRTPGYINVGGHIKRAELVEKASGAAWAELPNGLAVFPTAYEEEIGLELPEGDPDAQADELELGALTRLFAARDAFRR